MILNMRYFGDPILREETQPVAEVSEELRALIENMVDTMRDQQGVGLAAPQIGRTERLCVVEVPVELDEDEEGNRLHPDLKMPLVLLNPEISGFSEDVWTMEEGCLSFPGVGGQIRRPLSIGLAYQDEELKRHEIEVTGYVARVIQHEVDHLDGVLFIDRMSAVRKAALAGRLRRMRKSTESELGIA